MILDAGEKKKKTKKIVFSIEKVHTGGSGKKSKEIPWVEKCLTKNFLVLIETFFLPSLISTKTRKKTPPGGSHKGTNTTSIPTRGGMARIIPFISIIHGSNNCQRHCVGGTGCNDNKINKDRRNIIFPKSDWFFFFFGRGRFQKHRTFFHDWSTGCFLIIMELWAHDEEERRLPFFFLLKKKKSFQNAVLDAKKKWKKKKLASFLWAPRLYWQKILEFRFYSIHRYCLRKTQSTLLKSNIVSFSAALRGNNDNVNGNYPLVATPDIMITPLFFIPTKIDEVMNNNQSKREKQRRCYCWVNNRPKRDQWKKKKKRPSVGKKKNQRKNVPENTKEIFSYHPNKTLWRFWERFLKDPFFFFSSRCRGKTWCWWFFFKVFFRKSAFLHFPKWRSSNNLDRLILLRTATITTQKTSSEAVAAGKWEDPCFSVCQGVFFCPSHRITTTSASWQQPRWWGKDRKWSNQKKKLFQRKQKEKPMSTRTLPWLLPGQLGWAKIGRCCYRKRDQNTTYPLPKKKDMLWFFFLYGSAFFSSVYQNVWYNFFFHEIFLRPKKRKKWRSPARFFFWLSMFTRIPRRTWPFGQGIFLLFQPPPPLNRLKGIETSRKNYSWVGSFFGKPTNNNKEKKRNKSLLQREEVWWFSQNDSNFCTPCSFHSLQQIFLFFYHLPTATMVRNNKANFVNHRRRRRSSSSKRNRGRCGQIVQRDVPNSYDYHREKRRGDTTWYKILSGNTRAVSRQPVNPSPQSQKRRPCCGGGIPTDGVVDEMSFLFEGIPGVRQFFYFFFRWVFSFFFQWHSSWLFFQWHHFWHVHILLFAVFSRNSGCAFSSSSIGWGWVDTQETRRKKATRLCPRPPNISHGNHLRRLFFLPITRRSRGDLELKYLKILFFFLQKKGCSLKKHFKTMLLIFRKNFPRPPPIFRRLPDFFTSSIHNQSDPAARRERLLVTDGEDMVEIKIEQQQQQQQQQQPQQQQQQQQQKEEEEEKAARCKQTKGSEWFFDFYFYLFFLLHIQIFPPLLVLPRFFFTSPTAIYKRKKGPWEETSFSFVAPATLGKESSNHGKEVLETSAKHPLCSSCDQPGLSLLPSLGKKPEKKSKVRPQTPTLLVATNVLVWWQKKKNRRWFPNPLLRLGFMVSKHLVGQKKSPFEQEGRRNSSSLPHYVCNWGPNRAHGLVLSGIIPRFLLDSVRGRRIPRNQKKPWNPRGATLFHSSSSSAPRILKSARHLSRIPWMHFLRFEEAVAAEDRRWNNRHGAVVIRHASIREKRNRDTTTNMKKNPAGIKKMRRFVPPGYLELLLLGEEENLWRYFFWGQVKPLFFFHLWRFSLAFGNRKAPAAEEPSKNGQCNPFFFPDFRGHTFGYSGSNAVFLVFLVFFTQSALFTPRLYFLFFPRRRPETMGELYEPEMAVTGSATTTAGGRKKNLKNEMDYYGWDSSKRWEEEEARRNVENQKKEGDDVSTTQVFWCSSQFFKSPPLPPFSPVKYKNFFSWQFFQEKFPLFTVTLFSFFPPGLFFSCFSILVFARANLTFFEINRDERTNERKKKRKKKKKKEGKGFHTRKMQSSLQTAVQHGSRRNKRERENKELEAILGGFFLWEILQGFLWSPLHQSIGWKNVVFGKEPRIKSRADIEDRHHHRWERARKKERKKETYPNSFPIGDHFVDHYYGELFQQTRLHNLPLPRGDFLPRRLEATVVLSFFFPILQVFNFFRQQQIGVGIVGIWGYYQRIFLGTTKQDLEKTNVARWSRWHSCLPNHDRSVQTIVLVRRLFRSLRGVFLEKGKEKNQETVVPRRKKIYLFHSHKNRNHWCGPMENANPFSAHLDATKPRGVSWKGGFSSSLIWDASEIPFFIPKIPVALLLDEITSPQKEKTNQTKKLIQKKIFARGLWSSLDPTVKNLASTGKI